MKVTKIETFKYWIDWCNWLFVKVSTDEGLYGWGEGSLHGAIASVETAIHELGAALIGQDPSGPERHWQALYHAWRWRGGPTLFTALGALDIALWDLEGKRLGVPVYRLLGGPLRTELRGYASHWLSGVTTPEGAYEGAREAARRGALTAREIIVIADGAHWIWHLTDEHFPEATQIVDWYQASHYVWQAAHAIYGEGMPLAKRSAKRRLAELWAGQVPKVLHALGKAPQHAAVQEAITYYTYHQQRMCYADYRARGLQIGSGTMKSGCKQIATARLKQAGMIWSVAGARAVAAVRTWLKSDRWTEAMTLRPLRQRTYHRRAA